MRRPITVEVTPASETTYNGFYLRNNLSCTGTVPSAGPYNLCPDIIQSCDLVPNAQSELSTTQSWGSCYATEPVPGQANYYYVRGLNGAATPISARLSLYYTPAQLIMLPTTWKNNALTTEQGLDYVNVQADTGYIGVGDDAFVWQKPPIPADGSDFYSFVAQVNDADNSNPIPTVTSWLDMAQLLTQDLGFGFRNTCYVNAEDTSWSHRLMLNIPSSISTPGKLQILISASGFQGNTVALLGDTIPANKQPILSGPQTITSNNYLGGTTIAPEAGFSTSIALQYWNDAHSQPLSGSTITVSVNYIVPNTELQEAGNRGLLNNVYSRYMQESLQTTPQQVIALGCAIFAVA